ncbi:hypothetical protein [Gilliamella sp. Bif1-4]|uniref:hypothetical protein n=1 Tax=Gilliamella sp. Bif1-4 TaxID=3120233 RepID=UPI00080D962F|nr:hypothetical protein [Gilliamella apicola]OCG41332.1 hypothetical protein A9G25_06340 [Gilliamella apicola]
MVAFSGLRLPAGNKQSLPIQGWVNIKDNTQTHIKRRSLWHWSGFETIEEKATVGELSDKLGKNKVAKLDLDDYTPAMRALHQILTGTLIYSTQRKKDLPPPTFTDSNLKEGLRRSWTAEQIGHLLVRYESEWYADAALSKWNEIDELFEEEKRQQKALIEEGLDKLGITRPYQRDFAMEKVDEAHEYVKTNWQREKEQRIKPALWWQQVAQAQAQVQNQTASTEQSEANSSKLTNLSTDGKAWFIHPIAMIDYFKIIDRKRNWAESPFALLLGKVESNNDYSAYNQTKPKLKAFFNTNLTSMTIEELINKQTKREIFAAGRFQIIPQTLKAAVAYLKLDLSLKYNKKTQDILFEEYLIKIKRKNIIKYLEHDGDIEDAIYDWAKEFASAGVRKGKTISGGRVAAFEGSSYYQGDGLNSAHILPDQMVKVLRESKNGNGR